MWHTDKDLGQCLFYMCTNQMETDITVFCADGQLNCHRLVLMARSSTFHNLLYNKELTSLTFEGIHLQSARAFIRYLYCDTAVINEQNVFELLCLSKVCVLPQLEHLCSQYLKTVLTASNFCGFLPVILDFQARSLMAHCEGVFSAVALPSWNIQDFHYDALDLFLTYITNQKKVIDSLDAVWMFDNILSWTERECRRQYLAVNMDNQRKVLGALLRKLPFARISLHHFAKFTMPEQLLTKAEIQTIFNIQIGRSECSDYAALPRPVSITIQPSEVIDLIEKAIEYEVPKLEELCQQTFAEQTTKVLLEDSFVRRLSKKGLSRLLDVNKISCSEVTLWQFCRKWAEHAAVPLRAQDTIDPGEVRNTLGGLLYKIRFPTMSQPEFTSVVSKSNILNSEEMLEVYKKFSNTDMTGEDLFFNHASRQPQT